jgi:hypothetical protein
MLQGLGAGSLMTIGMTIIGELFALERRAKMQGYISGVWGVASLCGPLVGGLLTDHVSWRWVFYINLPFGAVAMGLIAAGLTDRPRDGRRPAIDYAGLGLFTAGVSALLVGVLEAGRVTSWTGLDVQSREESGYTGPERRVATNERRDDTGLERRRGPGRRRSDDRKAAEEGEMTAEQFEFCMAIEMYKKVNKRLYPTWTEVLEVVRQLGYRKVEHRNINLPNVPEPELAKLAKVA